MLDPGQLIQWEPDLPDLTGLVLVEALDGFIDAGGARRIACDHLLSTLESRVVARFDLDQVLDYRGRRPAMVFVEDHWEGYEDPQLAVHLMRDAAETEFLLLAGLEPDYQWERFVEAVRLLVDRFGVRLTIGLNAIPMGVPHTRPLGITAHANRAELLAGSEPWVSTVQVPGSAGHLLEYRLGKSGLPTMGFAAHVPHYLAQTPYPAAAEMLLEATAAAGGLVLPSGELGEQAAAVREAINERVEQSPQFGELVTALEEQYDQFVAGREGLLGEGAEGLPTADELGAELERFLAQETRRGDAGDS
ncbi:MAG: PAC2 family protein [Actinomycetota bacterium]|nr:PAC2 family protein [Actinomycetota bacterium]